MIFGKALNVKTLSRTGTAMIGMIAANALI